MVTDGRQGPHHGPRDGDEYAAAMIHRIQWRSRASAPATSATPNQSAVVTCTAAAIATSAIDCGGRSGAAHAPRQGKRQHARVHVAFNRWPRSWQCDDVSSAAPGTRRQPASQARGTPSETAANSTTSIAICGNANRRGRSPPAARPAARTSPPTPAHLRREQRAIVRTTRDHLHREGRHVKA